MFHSAKVISAQIVLLLQWRLKYVVRSNVAYFVNPVTVWHSVGKSVKMGDMCAVFTGLYLTSVCQPPRVATKLI